MKRSISIVAGLLFSTSLMAQIPEDALRMGLTNPSGTARNMAIGGAMASLGGEITATFVNPAGLGLYKTGEFVLSPGFTFQRGKGSFRGTDAKADNLNKFNFGTSGFVFGFSNRYSRWRSNAISFAVNRTANFNSNTYYKGQNDYSSFSEEHALDFANSGLSLDGAQWKNSSLISLPTKMAVYEYLIDTATINGNTIIIGQGEKPGLLNQEKSIKTTGGVTEVAFGYAANMDDKLFVGFGLGLPILNYSRTSYIKESDATGNADNDFNYASYEETLTQKGIGLNAKLGLIVKPTERVRIGLAIHTPTLYGINENITSAKMVTDLEKYAVRYGLPAGADSVSLSSNNFPVFENKFDFVSPWKFIVSGSFVLHEVEDVTKQKGFITADVEYVTGHSSKFNAADPQVSNTYFNAVNQAVKALYKSTFNFRVGGELKFNTIMGRLGFAYFGNPYKESELKGQRMNLSGGLGYRNKGIFIDLTYVHAINKDVNFPYRLSDKANTYATLKDTRGNVMLTFGVKF